MIYNEPKISIGGDQFVLVEFGNEMTLPLNFLVRSFDKALKQNNIPGILETVPSIASCMIHYDAKYIKFNRLVEIIQKLFLELDFNKTVVFPSRLFHIPILYFDPWSQECIEDYCKKIKPKELMDADYIVQLNHLKDRDDLMRVHSGAEYWVAGVGFFPGFPLLMPLDSQHLLFAPKYNPPRVWTPKGALGIGGGFTSIYPAIVPGGYQIFAYVPVPICDPEAKLDQFKSCVCLFKPGDRVKFVPKNYQEIEAIQAEVDAGTYHYNVENQQFPVKDYLHSIKEQEKTEA